jgi:hypothetical protein
MIGISTGIYIGGLPRDFEIKQVESDTRLQVRSSA